MPSRPGRIKSSARKARSSRTDTSRTAPAALAKSVWVIHATRNGAAGDLIDEGGDTIGALLRHQPGDLDVVLSGASESGSVDQPNERVSEGLDRRRRRPGERCDDAQEIARADIADGVLAAGTDPGDENAKKAFDDESDELRRILSDV